MLIIIILLNPLLLNCFVFQDETLITPSKRLILKDDGMTLLFNKTEVGDEGIYRCEALNSEGSEFRQAPLKFKGNFSESSTQ